MAPQLPNYKRIKQRIRRSLNFGGKAPRSLHLPLTEMMVEYFNQASPFDYLKPETSASISSCGFADTCTLVVAMCYLERLRQKEKETFEATNPTEMYLPALVLASKYLHDSDQEERVADGDWAEMAGISKKELAMMEWQFVKAIDWNVCVDENEFERRLAIIESWVASDFLSKYSFATYNELNALTTLNLEKLKSSLRILIAALGLSLVIYSFAVASILTLPHVLPSTSTHVRNITLPDRHAALIKRELVVGDDEGLAPIVPCLPNFRPTVTLPAFVLFNATKDDVEPRRDLLSFLFAPSSLVIP